METFIYSEYVIMGRKPSEIVEGYMHEVEAGVACPRCKTANRPTLEHGEKRQCVKCKLNIQRHGNGLEVWV